MNLPYRFLAALVLLALAGPVAARGFEGVVSHVTDGDTLWVRPAAGGPPRQVRLNGIDAPEICQGYGTQARDALRSLVLHRRVVVASRARDDYRRVLGRVSVGGHDVGAWMVSRGHAWSYRFRRDAGPYAKEEFQARRMGWGLWANAAVTEPRHFRKQHGSCRGPGARP